MAHQAGKQTTKRSKPSYAYAIVSVTLTLFMLGLVGSLLLYSESGSRYLKEQIEINIELKKTASEVDILQLQKKLDKEPFVKSSKYYSKEDAAKIMQDKMGAQIDDLGYNPYFDRLEFKFHHEYTHPDSLEKISTELKKNPLTADVYYLKDIANFANYGLKRAGYALGALGLLVLFISLVLIDNTIRLMMYSNRFLIKSMQLVGATRWFIIKPFIMRGIFNGFISATIALLALLGFIYWYLTSFSEVALEIPLINFAVLFLSVMLIGLIISTFSTYRAVSKYLTLKLDELY